MDADQDLAVHGRRPGDLAELEVVRGSVLEVDDGARDVLLGASSRFTPAPPGGQDPVHHVHAERGLAALQVPDGAGADSGELREGALGEAGSRAPVADQ